METKESNKLFAEILILANRIDTKTHENEAVIRSIMTFQEEFNNRRIDEAIDNEHNSNFSGYLQEIALRNNNDIQEMNDKMRRSICALID